MRDRAILRTFLYTGIRLGTGCRLKVSDFHQEGDQATLRLLEKGAKRRTICSAASVAKPLLACVAS